MKSCPGVWINDVCWAEYNVDEPGVFADAAKPYGMLYQWNRKKGWPATGTVTGWDSSIPPGDYWDVGNDPCPAGWRVPTGEEIKKLLDRSKVTSDSVSVGGICGKTFTDNLTGNRIFLPALLYRKGDGSIANKGREVCTGFYWSGSSDFSSAPALFFNLSVDTHTNWPKMYALAIRCVADWNCDTIVTDTSESICVKDLPYIWGDTVFLEGTETGTYYFQHISTVSGCDSIVRLHLTVHQIFHSTLTDTVCSGSNYKQQDIVLPAVYADTLVHDTLKNAWGCDSLIRTLLLTVFPSFDTLLYDTICQGDIYYKHGFDLPAGTSGGLFTKRYTTVHGCDSTVTLNLHVHAAYDTLLYDTICQGDIYYKHGFDLPAGTSGGLFTKRYTTVHGCDSTVTLNLHVHAAYDTLLYDTICQGDIYYKHGFDLPAGTSGGLFTKRYTAVHGCDSIVTLELYVCPAYFYPHTEKICEGDTFVFRDRQLYEGGIYYDSLTTVKGCDSIHCLYLDVHPVYEVRLSGILCEGSSYMQDDFYVTTPGVHYRYLKSASGCDSTIVLTLAEEKKTEGDISFQLEDCSTHGYSFFFEPAHSVDTYRWDMGDGTLLYTEEGYHHYADSGTYRIELRTETPNGCENSFAYVQRVSHYLPAVPIYIDRQVIDEDDPTVHFRVEVLPGMTCRWDFGDGTTGEGDSISHTYDATAVKYYDVTLNVINADSCITESSIRIEVALFPKIANTFTPNGDGINDVFMGDCRIEIIDRNGLRIFTGDKGWDGTYNGRQAKEDTYFYRLYFRTATGERQKTGYVTLIR